MDNAGVAVFVKSKAKPVVDGKAVGEFKDTFLFGGRFENIAASEKYLKFLAEKKTECYVQIGFVGWGP